MEMALYKLKLLLLLLFYNSAYRQTAIIAFCLFPLYLSDLQYVNIYKYVYATGQSYSMENVLCWAQLLSRFGGKIGHILYFE